MPWRRHRRTEPTIDPSLSSKAIRTYRDKVGGSAAGGGKASATETK